MDVSSTVSKLEPFSFKGMSDAQDKAQFFENKLDEIRLILVSKKNNKVAVDFYGRFLTELTETDLTEEQENKIYEVFRQYELYAGAVQVLASRTIFRWDPKKDTNNEKLNETLLLIQKFNIWERIHPNIKELSPVSYELIVAKYKEIEKILQDHFKETLESLESSEINDAFVQKFIKFESNYKENADYKSLDWEAFYNLVRAKFSYLSEKDRSILLAIYINAKNKTTLKSQFDIIKIYILRRIAEPLAYKHIQNDESFDLLNLEVQFKENDLNGLKTDQIQQIAELCAYLDLSPEQEKSTYELLPDKTKDPFLLERFRVYCQNLKNIKKSKIWNLEAFKTFFDSLCYKLYYGQIEAETFRLMVQCSHEQLNEKQIEELKKASCFYYISNDYQCCLIMAKCYQLKHLEKDVKKVFENMGVKKLFENVTNELNNLVKLYTTRYLDIDKWMGVFDYIKSLGLSNDLYIPILEIFRHKREPNSMLGSIVSNGKRYWYGGKSPQVGSTWKGEKYDIFFNTTQNWVKINQEWIQEHNKEVNDNSKDMIKKVQELFQWLEKMEFEKKSSSLSKEDIFQHNQKKRDEYITWMDKLREVLKDPEFIHAFDRYMTLGQKHASGAVLILKEICNFRVTGINAVPFIVNLMKKLIPLGLEELAKTKREVGYMAEFELLKFKKPLQLSLDLQNEAIEGLPEEFKTPYFHLIGKQIQSGMNYNWDPHRDGNLPYMFLSIQYENLYAESKEVKFIRIATPTGPNGINPEFKVFLCNEYKDNSQVSLFISLQSSTETTEASRIKEFMNQNQKNIFITAFPVTGSYYMQEDQFSEPALYQTFVSFKQSLTEKFIAFKKGQVEVNQPGNYLLPESWLASSKFKKALEKCMDDVKMIFFPDTEVLNESERRIFIKLFNIRFAFFLISYTSATRFGFLCNHSADRTGVYNALLLKLLTIIFENKDKTAFSEDENAFTFEEMWRALVHGVPLVTVKRAMNHRLDELTEALALLENPEVQQRLLKNKEIFKIKEMSYPDFTPQKIKSDDY